MGLLHKSDNSEKYCGEGGVGKGKERKYSVCANRPLSIADTVALETAPFLPYTSLLVPCVHCERVICTSGEGGHEFV